MRVRVRAAVAGCGCGPTMNVILNFSMRFVVRLCAEVAGHDGVIVAKEQRSLFQLRLRAAVAGRL